jgi:hypothetical protein
MFKSRVRDIIFPQYEHGRLAGTVARAWGNEAFERPALDFDAFVAGVTLHDWGYGTIDNLPIGAAPEKEWLEVIRKNVEKRYDHPTTDIIVKLHLRRLLSMFPSAAREALIAQVDERIDGRLLESEAPFEKYRRADKITRLCDMISFAFCFESPSQLTYEVFPQQGSDHQMTDITFEIRPSGEIIVTPWPFSVPIISGVTYAFEAQGYPDTLNPLVVPFKIIQIGSIFNTS